MSTAAVPVGAIDAALDLLPRRMGSPWGRVHLVAIGLQESGFEHRAQVIAGRPGVKGPARGFWQFERGGGVAGVLTHRATQHWAHAICVERRVEPAPLVVWERIETDDVLAAAFARLLLWSDPAPLPQDESGAWGYYLRNWRPGKPHPGRWPRYWARAVQTVWGDD